MRVLVLTNMWPTQGRPQFGVFVRWEVAELRRLGVDVDVLFVDGRASTLNYAKALQPLQRMLGRGRYDLVHAHYVFSAVLARAQRQLPIVLTHHGIEVLRGWQAPLSAYVSQLVDGVIVKSEQMRARLRRPDAQVIASGVDFGIFAALAQDEARRRLNLPPDKRIVLFVGEPRPEKRLDIIDAAVGLVSLGRPNVELRTISGLPQPRVALHLNAADVLVLASDGEGSPTVVKEAMACNLPIVSVDVGDVREIIAGTEGCAICDQTPEDMARKLDSALSFARRTRGRDAVRQYSWSAIARQVLACYEDVLGGASGPRLLRRKARGSGA